MFFFFFNDTATTEIYTLSLHDALPISSVPGGRQARRHRRDPCGGRGRLGRRGHVARRRPAGTLLRRDPGPSRRSVDRKSTRLNSSHSQISYAVFCLKKKKKKQQRYYLA